MEMQCILRSSSFRLITKKLKWSAFFKVLPKAPVGSLKGSLGRPQPVSGAGEYYL